ncbi:aminotransferase class I/II-fold pyridoxal phosphate-dependent enzyme [Halalkalibacter sp. APA_J-10(15)]|uniref:aminotransferase class I/II-fold pyridoxal phosphate-dependent enzyme n=1 Tax=unclassified Halalkalibacter TaxID=2893063 RepID=UPI001FF3E459|nr:aminotransferase class I/II-fold pyridoxal phosphate-dependent enzyme [Halalkalibacter sp. APA_J-10(15)]MCK0470350.1 aminotransferase class I/II-fold pyridoxal phosphate-dependent enzyme [Halalkalibacter sp. APA_J-10(15)]
MSGEELAYVQDALQSNWIAPLGPHVNHFEKEIAEYVGVKGAVAVSSGTAAIHLALHVLNVTEGDRVFCSSLTFVASANPILYRGAEPVFIDADPDTWNMSTSALEAALAEAAQVGRLPRAVIVVHLYGQVANMSEICSLCDQYGVPVIEDAAESLGSTYEQRHSGSMGLFGVYSFNGNKIITTSGGGMLVSNDQKALEKALYLATQAKDPTEYYQHRELGYNYRMSNLLAAVGRSQLKVLKERVHARRAVFLRYVEQLGDIPGFIFTKELENTRSNRWLTTLRVDNSKIAYRVDDIRRTLVAHNIEARPVWKPLHLQPMFNGVKYYPHEKGMDVAQHLFHTGICLPSGSNLRRKDQMRIIQCIKETISFEKIAF